jgi:hypothetical protein
VDASVKRLGVVQTIKKIIVHYRTLDQVMSTTISVPVRRPSSYYFRGSSQVGVNGGKSL